MEYEDVVKQVEDRLNVPNGTAEALIAEFGQPVEDQSSLNALVRWVRRQQRKARKRWR